MYVSCSRMQGCVVLPVLPAAHVVAVSFEGVCNIVGGEGCLVAVVEPEAEGGWDSFGEWECG